MLDRIILLTGETEAPYLRDALTGYNPGLSIEIVTNARSLERAASVTERETRLIAFCTDVIVTPPCLAALPGPAYNFHAAPPEYPGSAAAAFAIYEDADTFGITVHEIAPMIDSGPIVHVRRFPIRPGARAADIEGQAYGHLIEAFSELAERLATDPAPLPRIDETWRGPARTRADADRLRNDLAGLDVKEIARRRRAFGPPVP